MLVVISLSALCLLTAHGKISPPPTLLGLNGVWIIPGDRLPPTRMTAPATTATTASGHMYNTYLGVTIMMLSSKSRPASSRTPHKDGGKGITQHRPGSAGAPSNNKKKKKVPAILLFIVGFGCLLVWQATRQASPSASYAHFDLPSIVSSSSYDDTGLGPPRGEAIALPNLQKRSKTVDNKRLDSHYGGVGDSAHLGGFASGERIDMQGISPHVWKHMVKDYNIKSVLDLGCGRGFATAWFYTHGLRTRGVDGSKDAFRQSAIPKEKQADLLVEHDFARGPWWPGETYDAVWSVEFMEHVGINYMKNYVPTLRKAALIFMTTSRWGGWHHVEVHPDSWWIRKYESLGFKYSEEMTKEVRSWATTENNMKVSNPFATKKAYNPQHIFLSMKVFVNPVVASLPQHDHLFYEPGCFQGREKGINILRECGRGEESRLPDNYNPLVITSAMDKAWESLVLTSLDPKKVSGYTAESISKILAIDGGQKNLTIPYQPLPELLERVKKRNFTNMPTIPVFAWPYVHHGVRTAEHKHLEENGIEESPYLRLSKDIHDLNEHIVWVGDTGWGAGWDRWCGEFGKLVSETMQFRISQGMPPRWPIFIVDFTDQANLQRCRNIENLMGIEYISYSTRSVGRGRSWDALSKWVRMGYRYNTKTADGIEYQHTPLMVRTDTVKALHEVLEKRGLKLSDPIETLARSMDAIHLWPLNETKKVNTQYANLRIRVSEILADFGQRHNINYYVGLAGRPLREGRRGVDQDYIETLLDTKIVVIAQRDFWEDHYRLMEAFVSGTCVLTDFMHGLPEGLVNGTSVLEYTSQAELEALLLYYLEHDEERIEIGKRGREIAMRRHRTWHRMEEIIFGEILSTCESKEPGGNCPYIVHAHESR